MFYVLKQITLLTLLIIVVACPGLKLLNVLGFTRENKLELFVLSTACGFALVSFVFCIFGMAGMLSPLLVIGAPFILLVVSLKEARVFLQSLAAWSKGVTWTFSLQSLLALSFAPFIIFNILKALLPPHGPTDVLYYHMTLPKLFLAREAIVTYPTFVPSFFPANGELLFTLSMVLGGPSFVGLTHFGFSLLTVIGLYAYAQKYVHTQFALLPGIIYVTAPVVNSWGTMAYTCAMVGFYLFIFTMLLLEEGPKSSRKEAAVWGVMAGMALGLKYQAIPLIGAITLCFCMMKIKASRRFLPQLLIALAVGTLIASPWFIRNYLVTGNPFFPVLDDLFPSSLIQGEGSRGGDTHFAGALASALKVVMENPFSFFSFLWFDAWEHEDFQRFIGPLFLGLVPFSLFLRRISPKWPLIVLSVTLCLVSALLLRGNMRYVLILVILMSFLSGAVVQEVLCFAKQWERVALVSFFSLAVLLYSFQNYHLMLSHDRIFVALNPDRAVSFLRTFERSFRPAELAHELIPRDATVLFHGFVRYFYFNFEPLNDYCGQTFLTYDNAKNGRDILEIMRSRGITHIFHEDRIHEKKRTRVIMYNEDPRFVEFMDNYLERIGSVNGITFYKIREPGSRSERAGY